MLDKLIRKLDILIKPYKQVFLNHCKKAAVHKSAYKGSTKMCISTIDESRMLLRHNYDDHCSKLAEFPPCMSCNKLCYKSDCVL